MQHTRTLRLVAVLATVALMVVACGDDDTGGDTDTDTDTETTEDGGDTEGGDGGDASGGADLEALREAGVMRVGIKFDQPLFGVNAPGGVVGFDAEIAKLIGERVFEDFDPANNIEFTEAVSANREPFLENDQVDIVAATYTINDERDEVVDFAGPYYVAGQDIMVLEGNPEGIEGIDDLNTPDLTTCSVDGSTSIQNFEEQAPDGESITFDTYSKCAEAMADGRADAVTTDNVILIGLIDESDGAYELVDNPFTDEPYGIGVQEGSDLRCFINGVLQEIYESGEWAEAYESTVGTAGSATPEPPEVDNEGC